MEIEITWCSCLERGKAILAGLECVEKWVTKTATPRFLAKRSVSDYFETRWRFQVAVPDAYFSRGIGLCRKSVI